MNFASLEKSPSSLFVQLLHMASSLTWDDKSTYHTVHFVAAVFEDLWMKLIEALAYRLPRAFARFLPVRHLNQTQPQIPSQFWHIPERGD